MSEKKPELFSVVDEPKAEDGYEKQEILGRRTLFWFVLVHFGSLVGTLILAIFLMRWFSEGIGPANVELPAGAPARVLPPQPRLQADPHRDIKTLHIKDEDLHRYSVNRDTGAVHLPIERAIEIVASENLPHRGGDGQ